MDAPKKPRYCQQCEHRDNNEEHKKSGFCKAWNKYVSRKCTDAETCKKFNASGRS